MTAPGVSPTELLRLMRLASPALPVGGFSYSEGLESAVESGRVVDEASAFAWLVDQLHLALARSDLAVVALAVDAWRRHDRTGLEWLNTWVASSRETDELRRQSAQMGRSMLHWLRLGAADTRLDTLDALPPGPTWPVAFALGGAIGEAPVRDIVVACAASWAENQAQAAMRTVPLGQSSGQRLIAGLHAEIGAAVDTAEATSFEALQAFTPMLAILSAQHESQYSRLFRS